MEHKDYTDDEKKQFLKNQRNILEDAIDSYTDELWLPYSDGYYFQNETDSWFKSSYNPNSTDQKYIFYHDFPTKDSYIASATIRLFPTASQRKIIKSMLQTFRLSYNVTIKFLRKKCKLFGINGIEIFLNFKKLRTKYLWKTKKSILHNGAFFKITYKNGSTKIKSKHGIKKKYVNEKKRTLLLPPSHLVDCAFKLACANFKSAQTNFNSGHIKKFRIRYWRPNKKQLTMSIEALAFSKKNETFYPAHLGKNMKYKYKGVQGKDFSLKVVSCESILSYNRDTHNYVLYVPKYYVTTDYKTKNNFIGIDLGVRNFATTYNNEYVEKIGTNVKDKIKEILLEIDGICKQNISKSKKRRKKIRLFNKIKNMVNDLHWKCINQLTDENMYIFVGDVSAKKITCKRTANIDAMTKRVALILRYYVFRQRLEYKCMTKSRYYEKVREYYTTKMCTNCKNLKETKYKKLSIYECENCGLKFDRDGSSGRNIPMKGMHMLDQI